MTRITAQEDVKTKKSPKSIKTSAAPIVASKRRSLKAVATPFTATVAYFKGAWYELRQVRWPDRGATWGMTAALIGFTLFFVVIILLLDALFKYVFELILR